MVAQWLETLLSRDPLAPRRAKFYRWFIMLAVVAFTGETVLDTVPGIFGAWEPVVILADRLFLTVVAVDFFRAAGGGVAVA